MKSAACLRYGIKAKPCMESSRSDVCNQSEGEIHADAWCYAVALRLITYTLRVIPYQSFGLDRKKQVSRLAFFLAPPAGLEPATSWLTVMRSTDWAKEEYLIFVTFRCVGIDLFFRTVASQVSSAQQSLTSVFGMGTGGPSALETPTAFLKGESVSVRLERKTKIKLCVSIDLFSRSVARQVFSALQSLTSVFGMGTGGPSALETLTWSQFSVIFFAA